MQYLRYGLCRQCFKRVIVHGLAKPRVGACTTRLFTTSKPRIAGHDGRVKVRWFEQSGDESTRRPVSEFEAAEDNEAKALKAELDKEDAELREMRKELSPDELQELDKAMAEAKLGENFDELFNVEENEDDFDFKLEEGEDEDDFVLEEDEDLDLAIAARPPNNRRQPTTMWRAGAPKMVQYRPKIAKKNQHTPSTSEESQPKPLAIQLYLSKDQRPHLDQLNEALKLASVEGSDWTSQETLWQLYTKCKRTLPPFLTLIPDRSWDLLNESAKHSELLHKERVTRSRILLDDMKKGGRPRDNATTVTYIRLLLLEGRPEDAASEWEQDERVLRADGDLALQFEELGVSIFAHVENFEKAQELALGRMLQKVGPKSRALIPLIRARARKGDEEGLKTAWVLYKQFKIYMGSDMTLTDYDRIARIFLEAGRTDISVAVFRDYMLTTEPSTVSPDQPYDPTFSTLRRMITQTDNAETVSQISLTRLAILPSKYNNKYFYAAWMKRLIAAGHNKGALAIVQLMYYRGVEPDAKHLNGVVGAWLRNGTLKEKEKAISLAWSMVMQRLAFVAERNVQNRPALFQDTDKSGDIDKSGDTDKSGELGLVPPDISSQVVKAQMNRPLPCATIETFSLLLLYYSRRSMLGYVEKVQEMLTQAEIPPNSYFMNHLLYALLRRGDYDGVWSLYRKMSTSVSPNLETFACLWDTQKGHLGKVAFRSRQPDSFVSPRYLFCTMFEFLASQPSHEQKAMRESMSQELYDQIVRCFCLANDIEGTFVCLHALKNSFGFYPDERAARLVSIQISRLGEGTPEQPGRRRKRVPMLKIDLGKAAQIMGLLGEERREYLLARGIKAELMDDAFKNEESLYLLTSMLQAVLQKQLPEGTDVQEKLMSVSWEMGASGIYMGDHLEKPKVLNVWQRFRELGQALSQDYSIGNVTENEKLEA